MDRRTVLAATGALAAVALAGCLGDDLRADPRAGDGDDDSDGDGPDDPSAEPSATPDIPEDELRALARDNAAFGTDLYRQVSDDGTDNLFFSPYSISVALAMTYAGARGTTESEMEEALRFSAGQESHPRFGALHHELAKREETHDPMGDDDDPVDAFKLRVANALWGQAGVDFAADFLELTESYYGAGLAEADFANDPDGERERINAWVAEQTEDRITDLLPPGSLDPSTLLVLTNAIYFLASWESEFDPADTDDGTFYALDGSETTAAFMSQDLRTNYAAVEGAEAIELPYVGGEVSMVLVLPDEGTFGDFEDELDEERLFEIFEALRDHTGTLALPKFEIEAELELKPILSDLGMPGAFGADADFTGIFEGDGNAWIDEVYHDAFVTIDEEGTEAAAATAVVMVESAPPDWGTLRFDRPFLFCIRDRPTDSVLFLGRVADPGAAED